MAKTPQLKEILNKNHQAFLVFLESQAKLSEEARWWDPSTGTRDDGTARSYEYIGTKGALLWKQMRAYSYFLSAGSLEVLLQTPMVNPDREKEVGGMIVWRNDLFPADFFVRRSTDMKGESPAGQDLAARLGQPWFEWTGGALTYHATGDQDRLFAHMQSGGGPAPRLFRGTTDCEAMVHELGRKLAAREPLAPGWRESLQASLDKLAALVPRPRLNTLRFHGVYAPNARLAEDLFDRAAA